MVSALCIHLRQLCSDWRHILKFILSFTVKFAFYVFNWPHITVIIRWSLSQCFSFVHFWLLRCPYMCMSAIYFLLCSIFFSRLSVGEYHTPLIIETSLQVRIARGVIPLTCLNPWGFLWFFSYLYISIWRTECLLISTNRFPLMIGL